MQTQQQQQLEDDDHCVASQTDSSQHDCLSFEDIPEQIYLAQVQTLQCEITYLNWFIKINFHYFYQY